MYRFMSILTLFVSFAVINSACSSNDSTEQSTSKKNEMNSKRAHWLTFDDGLAKSAKEKKHLLIDFYTDWCHWCKVMDEKTFNNAEINKKLAERFITVRLEAENASQTATFKGKTYNNIELTRAFGISGFPSLAFLDSEGEIITIIPGYVPPETFTYILDYIDQECYKQKMPFEEFMKKKGECDDKK